MNKLFGNTYQARDGNNGMMGYPSKKGLPFNQSESLFGMAFYDFDTLAGDITGYQQQPVVSVPPRMQNPAPVFHPVDEYKDLSLKEILDLSDDFLSDDQMFGSSTSDLLEPVPLPASLTENHMVDPQLAPSADLSLSMSQQQQPPMMSNTDISSFNPKKRNLDSFEEEDDFQYEDESGNSGNNKERRFRPYQAGQWSEKFEELCEYREQFGHCLVPHTYNENLALARWVKRQRYQYKLMMEGKSSTMTPDRVKALEDIGFVWDSQGAAWGERLGELADFKKAYMHCNVPSNFSENPRLATWIKCQRRQYKLYMEGKPSNMTPQRIQHLENLGFEWELRSYKKQRVN